VIEVLSEQKFPPTRYVDELRRAGGQNPFGAPRFILFWGQTLKKKIGIQRWTARSASGISVGSYDALVGLNVPSWHLAEWRPPEKWGAPELWESGILGPYPARGDYEILQVFCQKKIVSGILKFDVWPLDLKLIRLMISIVEKHRSDSLLERKRYMAEQQAKKESAECDTIADCLADSLPLTSDGRVNYDHPLVVKKMEQIERNRRNVLRFVHQRPKGTSVA
jgi:hypothetical protein